MHLLCRKDFIKTEVWIVSYMARYRKGYGVQGKRDGSWEDKQIYR